MTVVYDESVLEISLDENVKTGFVPDSKPSKGDPFNVQLIPDLPPQPELEPGSIQVSNTAYSDSKLSIEDFKIPANKLTFGRFISPSWQCTSSVTSAQSLSCQAGLVDTDLPCQGK